MRTLLTTLAIGALASQAIAQTPDWTELFPATDPGPRAALQGASDGSKMYIFGGNFGPGVVAYDDLWSFDGTNWTLEAASGTGPSMRENYGLTWDDSRNVLVLFGGRDRGAGLDMGDTWEWSPTGGWTQVALTGTTPGPRRWHQLDYFPGLGCVLHAGNDVSGSGTIYDDTWAWNGTNWTQLANGPYKRQRGRMVYRGAPHNDLLWYGGRDEFNNGLDETWSFNGTSWSQIVTASAPYSPGVWAFGMYHDSVRDRVVFFGGSQGGVEKNQTWEFDGTDWTEVFPATVPSIRSGQATAWIASSNSATMYGGFSATQKDDTWTRGAYAGTGTFTVSGTGCATSVGLVGGLSASGLPTLGQSLVVNLTNGTPGTFPVALLGISDATWGAIPLPLALSLVFPDTPVGCDLLVSIDTTLGMAITPSGAAVTLPIPNKASLLGKTFYIQALQIELVLTGGLWTSTTPYGTAVIGN